MAERMTVLPGQLRQAAAEHRQTADELRATPANNAAVMATLDSLGPVFAELREAGRELLDQRRLCYEQQADAHADLADHLCRVAEVWERHDVEAADHLRARSAR